MTLDQAKEIEIILARAIVHTHLAATDDEWSNLVLARGFAFEALTRIDAASEAARKEPH